MDIQPCNILAYIICQYNILYSRILYASILHILYSRILHILLEYLRILYSRICSIIYIVFRLNMHNYYMIIKPPTKMSLSGHSGKLSSYSEILLAN